MSKAYNLYFIAIVPPEHICDEITNFKEDLAGRFNSRHALRVMPHITLKAPFKLPAGEHEKTVQWFERMSINITPYKQELRDFGAFHNKRNPVIFVKPVMNNSLKVLQQETLLNFLNAYPAEGILKLEIAFSPHITIAYRDLTPAFFRDAWKEYQERKYYATFEVDSFSLLQHDTRSWNIISNYRLQ